MNQTKTKLRYKPTDYNKLPDEVKEAFLAAYINSTLRRFKISGWFMWYHSNHWYIKNYSDDWYVAAPLK